MRVRCHAQGKFYTIECPEGTRVVRRSDLPVEGEAGPHDLLIVPLKGREIRIPADPPELLPLLAESGNFGVRLVGEPEADVRMEGVSCPGCGEADVTWLQLDDGSESAHCDRCGADFALPIRHVMPIPASDSRGSCAGPDGVAGPEIAVRPHQPPPPPPGPPAGPDGRPASPPPRLAGRPGSARA